MPRIRILAVAFRIITQISRDHRTLGLLLIVPIVVISLLGYIIRLPASTLILGVANQDQGFTTPFGQSIALGDVLLQALGDTEDLEIREISPSEAQAETEDGEIDAALVFPEDFTRRVVDERKISFTLILEGSDPSLSARVQGVLGKELLSAVKNLSETSGGPPAPELEIDTQYLYAGEDFDILDSFAPVFIAFVAFFLVFLLTGISFLRERAGGTLERLMATPVTRLDVALGYMLGFGVFALLQSTVILLFVIFVLRIHYVGNPLLIFLVEALLTIGSVNLGIFLSTFAKNELQVVQFMPLVIFPQALLSGILVPVKDLPGFLPAVAYALPLTYANQALRNVMLKGFDIGQIGWELVILAVFALVMILLAALTLRREIV